MKDNVFKNTSWTHLIAHVEAVWNECTTGVGQTHSCIVESRHSQLKCQRALTSKPMPASIHNTSEVKLFYAAPIKTIEAWLDEVEEPDATVIVKELGKAGSDLAQEPEVENSRKRKHSSSLTEENLSQSSLRKRSQYLLQLVTDYGMADNIMGAPQMPLTPKGSSADPPSTPSTFKTRSKAPVEPGWISDALALHGLKCDYNALGRYPEFEKEVFGIVKSERHSQMKPGSAKHIQQQSNILEDDNEATFLGAPLPPYHQDQPYNRVRKPWAGRAVPRDEWEGNHG